MWLSQDSELVINCHDKIRRMNVVRSPLLKDWRFISWESKGTFSMPPSTTHREYQALILGDYLRGNDCSWLLNGALVPSPLSFLLRHTGVCGVFNNNQPLPAGSEIGDFSFAYYDRCVCVCVWHWRPTHLIINVLWHVLGKLSSGVCIIYWLLTHSNIVQTKLQEEEWQEVESGSWFGIDDS